MADSTGRETRAEQTIRCQRGMLEAQGREIIALRREVRNQSGQLDGCLRTNGRLAHDLIGAWDLLWKIAGRDVRSVMAGDLIHMARSYLQRPRSTPQDRGGPR